MSPEDGLADALEYLQSELEAIEPCDSATSDQLFQHFVEKFGTPEEVAAAYAAACDAPGPEWPPGSETARRQSRAGPLSSKVRFWRRVGYGGAALVFVVIASTVAVQLNAWRAAGTPGRPVELGPAWAGRVVAFSPGNPPPSRSNSPRAALGAPDCRNGTKEPDTYVALGKGGQLVLEFTEGALFDGDGPDLRIVEIGPLAEAVEVSVSADGRNWQAIGQAKGAESTLDLAAHVKPGDRFRFVRLVDLGSVSAANNRWPGADIDAIVALHAVRNR